MSVFKYRSGSRPSQAETSYSVSYYSKTVYVAGQSVQLTLCILLRTPFAGVAVLSVTPLVDAIYCAYTYWTQFMAFWFMATICRTTLLRARKMY